MGRRWDRRRAENASQLEKTHAALGVRDTSRQAAAAVADQSQCGIALKLIKGAGPRGCTIDEISAATGWYPGTASARIDQLRRAGLIVELTGATRATRAGRQAMVFVAAPAAAHRPAAEKGATDGQVVTVGDGSGD